MREFEEIQIHIVPHGSEWVVSVDGCAPGFSQPPLDDSEVENLQLKVQQAAQKARPTRLVVPTELGGEGDSQGLGSVQSALKEKGEALYSSIFFGGVVHRLAEVCRRAGPNKDLRIRICADDDLAAFPFEILYSGQGEEVPSGLQGVHLAQFSTSTVVRSAANRAPKPCPEAIPLPLRILIVGASPDGLPRLEIEEEIENLMRVLNLPNYIDVQVIEGNDTETKLARELNRQKGVHILHFIGHGTVDPVTGQGALCFTGRKGGNALVNADRLKNIIGSRDIRLVTINACLGTAGKEGGRLASVATSIFNLGVPAVVAMQYEITDHSAMVFAEQFYGDLARGSPVDRAVTSARLSVLRSTEPESPEWATPVLYLGTESGDIFGLDVDPEKVLRDALEQLRSGNWNAARQTAAFADASGCGEVDGGIGARDVQRLADHCEEFVREWVKAESFFDHSCYPQGVEAITSVADHAAGRFSNYKMVFGEGCPVERRLSIALEVARAFDEKNYAEVIKLCEDAKGMATDLLCAQPGPSIDEDAGIRFEFLASAAKVFKELEKERGLADVLWKSGDWKKCSDELTRVIQRVSETTGAKTVDDLVARKATLETLLEIWNKLVESESPAADELSTAEDAFTALKQEDSDLPSNVDAVVKLLALARSALEANDGSDAAVNRCASIQEEFAEFEANEGESLKSLQRISAIELSISEVNKILQYEQATQAYKGQWFSRAKEGFEKLGEFRQSDRKAGLCQDWIDLAHAIGEAEWDDAKNSIAPLRDTIRDFSDLEHPDFKPWSRWCRHGPVVLSVLERMGNSELIFDPEVPWEGGRYPYAVLEDEEFSPISSMSVIQSVVRRMDRVEKEAWDSLRDPDRRLVADFYLYRVSRPEEIRNLAADLARVEEGRAPGIGSQELYRDKLCVDSGIYRVLEGSYEAAVDSILLRLKVHPENAILRHQLGLAATGLISHGERADDEGAIRDAWDKLIIGWGSVFADDDFWHDWWIQRNEIFDIPLSRDQIREVRQQLQRYWIDRLKASADICSGWDVDFHVEINSARAVAAGGGIPHRVESGQEAHLILGSQAVREHQLLSEVVEWTKSFEDEALQSGDWQRRVRCYFSELARSTALFEEGRYDEVVRELETEGRFSGRATIDDNPGFAGLDDGETVLKHERLRLLEESFRKLAIDAGSKVPMNTMEVIEYWEKAKAVAEERGEAQVEELANEITDFAIGRAQYLRDESSRERTKEALQEAADLLDEVEIRGWDNDDRGVRAALVQSLLDQATYTSNENNDEKSARIMAQRAYRLSPDSLRAIHVLCMATLHYANELTTRGDRERANGLLKEVEEVLLPHGEELFAGNAGLARCRQYIGEIRTNMSENGEGELGKMIQRMNLAAEDSNDGESRKALVEAMVAESQKEYAKATSLYWQLVQEDPEKKEMVEKLANCYRGWIMKAVRTGSETPAETRRIVSEAKERCQGSELLEELLEHFDEKSQ